MEFLTDLGGGVLYYAVPFLFVLTVVIFFHELGHFLVARWCGVKIDTFSIGFGPEIVGFHDRHGTRWRVAWIPLGGYVKFHGDASAASTPDQDSISQMSEEERRVSFHAKPLYQRAAIVAAGPLANFVLAILIFAVVFMTVGRFVTPAQVDSVNPDSSAAEAGFETGDVVLSIDGQAIEGFSDMQRIVSVNPGRELTFEVDRDGERVTLMATPQLREIEDRFGNVHRIGLLGIQRSADAGDVVRERSDPLSALWLGTTETWFVIDRTASYIWGLVTGREGADQLGGPIRIAQISGQVAETGFVALINLTAILSISIGILNLLPVPVLDGGHLMFYAIEAVRGRPLSERALDIGFRIGLALVLMLMVFVIWNDILQVTGL